MLTEHVGHRRGLAVALVYVAILGVCAAALLLLCWPATVHVLALQEQFARLTDRVADEQLWVAVIAVEESIGDAIASSGPQLLSSVPSAVLHIGTLLADALLVVIVSFYLLLDRDRTRRAAIQVVPADRRRAAILLERQVGRVLGGYLRAQLLTSLSIGLIVGLGCWLLHLPYAVALGLLAGMLELFPMFGPVLAALPAVVTALFMPGPTVVYVVLFFVAVQQVESNILVPRIIGRVLGLHPVATLFALVVGYQIAGAMGALASVPCIAIIWAIMRTARGDQTGPGLASQRK